MITYLQLKLHKNIVQMTSIFNFLVFSLALDPDKKCVSINVTILYIFRYVWACLVQRGALVQFFWKFICKQNIWKIYQFSLKISSQHLLGQSQQRKYQNDVNNVILMSLLLTLNKFHKLFWCFHCWLWSSKCQLGIADQLILHFFFLGGGLSHTLLSQPLT